jgi:hypothetical protein
MATDFIDKFFRILKFFQDNPIDVVKQNFSEESLSNPDTVKVYQNSLVFDPVYSLSYPKDVYIASNALQAREKCRKMMGRTMIPGSYAYNTKDMELFRVMLLDWFATSRTFKDTMRRCSNAFSLSDDDLDKAIRGFGIDFVTKDSLPDIIQRALFFLALTDLYKIKGSPVSVTRALQFCGVPKTVLREYWVERDPAHYKTLQIRGVPISKHEQYFDTSTNRYEYVDAEHREDVILSWENFQSRLWDIAEPHWWYTNEEILNYEFSPDVLLKLPSITPYFGIDYYPNISKYNTVVAILEKIMSDQFNSYLSGDKDLIPQEIGIDGYNEELTERDLWIDGYDQPLTMLECFLGFVYSQIRYDEYIQWKELYDFLIAHNVLVPADQYTYPWAYQELIYWGWVHKDDVVFGPILVDHIMKMFPKEKNNYYLATNELVSWWINRPLDPGETVAHTQSNIPEIFFSTDYPYRYQLVPTDISSSRIMYYNGDRNLNWKEPPFEYDETIADADREANQDTVRNAYDNEFKSYHASNRVNYQLPILGDAQLEYLNKYSEYLSWTDPDYVEEVEHDGSQLKPIYQLKWPKPFTWNWAIDSLYYYIAYRPTYWARVSPEMTWVGPAPYLPNSLAPTPGGDVTKVMGYQVYSDGYVYIYVSDQKWIRLPVETTWDYCDAPMSPDGTIRLSTDLAQQVLYGQIDSDIAQQYIDDKQQLTGKKFTLIEDPNSIRGGIQTRKVGLTELDDFITKYALTVDSYGNLIKDFSYYWQDNYVYFRVMEYGTSNVKWVRKLYESDWAEGSNGTKIYTGVYHFPNLDLVNRYDAERILKGQYVITVSDLGDLTEVSDGDNMLVCQGESGYPEVWTWNESLHSWSKTTNKVNEINLGFNNGLLDWINETTLQESDYEKTAQKFLNAFSNYVKITFRDPELDVAGLYKSIGYSGLFKNIINFFKPKRARLLYFSINLEFNERLFNSIKIDEIPANSKIVQEIRDYNPRNDSIYVRSENGMFKVGPHIDDVTTSTAAPANSVFYLSGFEDVRFNGYYYARPDLETREGQYYLINDHNVALTNIIMETTRWGYDTATILAFRKPILGWCDAEYVNYESDLTSKDWLLPSQDPSTTLVTGRKSILISDINPADLKEYDKSKTIDLSRYELERENHWNTINPRPEPSHDPSSAGRYKFTTNRETICPSLWTAAFCRDPINLRNVFPAGIAGYPENIEGGRIGPNDADLRNDENTEYQHSFWRSYPYSDDQLIIKDGPNPILARSNIDTYQFLSDSEFNTPGSSIPVWWVRAPEEYFSGPVHHRPTYIGVSENIYDCYPCRPWSECCDYYDIGCQHDGLPNPHISLWDYNLLDSSSSSGAGAEGQWQASANTVPNLLELFYDDFTHFHLLRGEFITDPAEQAIYEAEESIARTLDDPGDTFCTVCGTTTYTPDVAVFSIPLAVREAGVFHHQINATSFEAPYTSLNGDWTSDSGGGAYEVQSRDLEQLNSDHTTVDGLYAFKYGYIHSSGNYELVHVFHRPSGYHFWEIRQRVGPGVWTTLLRSEVKEKLHTLDDVIDENIGNWHVEQGNFLNGNDVDVVEDHWCDLSVTPTDFIGKDKEDIHQVHVAGRLESSTLVNITLENYALPITSPFYENKRGTFGDINYDSVSGYLYICVFGDPLSDIYLWRRAPFSNSWTLVDEPYIQPNDEPNSDGWFYRNSYLYLYVSTLDYVGWVRAVVPALSAPTVYTGQWVNTDTDAGDLDISCGGYSCARVRTDGTLSVWGSINTAAVPPPNSNFIDVSMGAYWGIALKSNGSIVQFGTPDNLFPPVVPFPILNTGFIQVACSDSSGYGLKSDGSIVAWGRNDYGQCNVPAPNTNFIQVSAAHQGGTGLKSDGSIVSWGWDPISPPYNDFVQLGTPSSPAGYTTAIRSNGTIFAQNHPTDLPIIMTPSPGTKYVKVSAGNKVIVGLRSDGVIVVNSLSPVFESQYHFTAIPAPNNFVNIGARLYTIMAERPNGEIVVWGRNESNQWSVPLPNGATFGMGRLVSDIDTFPNVDGELSESYVCGDPLPFLETYEGIRRLLMMRRCECTLKEKVFISMYEYTLEDPTGDYIRITNTDGKEHRFISRLIDPADYVDELLPNETWTRVTNNEWTITGDHTAYSAIAMSSDGMHQTAGLNSGQLYVSHDYGSTWVFAGPSAAWADIDMSNDGKYQTAVAYGTQIYVSSDWGTTWLPNGPGANWGCVSVSGDGKYQTAGVNTSGMFGGGQLYLNQNYGIGVWTAVDAPQIPGHNPSQFWAGVDMSDDGMHQSAVAWSGYVFVSHDYGSSWVAKNEFQRNHTHISMSSDGKYQTLTVDGGLVYTDNNFGDGDVDGRWQAAPIPSDGYRDVAMSSTGQYQVVAVYMGVVYISNDYGQTWTEIAPLNGWLSISISSDGNRIAGGTTIGLNSDGYIHEYGPMSHYYKQTVIETGQEQSFEHHWLFGQT